MLPTRTAQPRMLNRIMTFGSNIIKYQCGEEQISVPDKTGLKTYQYPKEAILVLPATAINAVAPPGGCSVRVICIKTIDEATANGAVNQIISGNRQATVTPTNADTTCPPTRFRGCASGLCIEPYTSTEDAPNEPIRKTFSNTGRCSDCIKAIIKMPTKAPTKDQICSRGSTSVSR